MPPLPKTRSRTSTPATAPVPKTYRSSRPPQQAHFPGRTKKIKTYGRSSSARTARQQTLTQLNYVTPTQEEEQDMGVLVGDSPVRGQKRRRTMGDSPASSFHTQTLTQFMSAKGEESDQERLFKIKDSEDEDGFGGFDTDDENEEKIVQDSMKEEDDETQVKAESRDVSVVPQTPAGKRTKTEIPSSQPTPFTPMLERYTPGGDMRSPLKEKSTNVGAPLSAEKILSKTPRTLVIEDSFCTVPSTTHSEDRPSPAHRTPLKELRPSQVRARMNTELGGVETDDKRSSQDEIPDSDDEWGSLGPTPQKSDLSSGIPDPGTPTPRPRERRTARFAAEETQIPESPVANEESAEIKKKEEVGQEEPTISDIRTSSLSPLAKKQQTIISSSADIDRETPVSSPPRAPSTSPNVAPNRTPVKHTPAKTQFFSQGLESQRVPLEIIQSLGAVEHKSDIIISIHPQHVDSIVNGTKSHEFRNYRIPASVNRFWIYITRPSCQLRYMAHAGTFQRPGEIDGGSGVGNAEFNAGRGAKYAYELRQVYELNNPVSLDVMRQNGWVEAPPQTFCYVPPAVAGQLLGNLRCALFDDGSNPLLQQSSGGIVDMSISQEVEAQLKSDIAHSTQQQQPSSPSYGTQHATVVPSSQAQEPLGADLPSASSAAKTEGAFFARPSLPASKTGSSSQRRPTTAASSAYVRPSQATTASQPSSQQAPLSPDKSSVPRPQMTMSSIPPFPEDLLDDDDDGDTPLRDGVEASGLPFSLGSSSQLVLPDSLYEDVRKPPVLLDSEDEDE